MGERRKGQDNAEADRDETEEGEGHPADRRGKEDPGGSKRREKAGRLRAAAGEERKESRFEPCDLEDPGVLRSQGLHLPQPPPYGLDNHGLGGAGERSRPGRRDEDPGPQPGRDDDEVPPR